MHRIVVSATLLLASAGTLAAQAPAPEFPVRPIRIVVGFTPGGQPDIFSRMIGTKLGENGVNIAQMYLGRKAAGGRAVAVGREARDHDVAV